NDPDGNVFDISQKDMANRSAIYVENDGKANPRHINHVALRTMNPDDTAEFYRHVFELAPTNKQAGDPNHYLTDGHVTLVIMPRPSHRRLVTRVTLAALTSLALGAGAAAADPVADFYKGKQLNWILSAGAGGGYSSYAHVFAPYFSAHIPGKPNIVVQNMPGAGGIRAMIYLANVAPKDGSTIGLVHSSVPYAPLYGIRGANFDPR